MIIDKAIVSCDSNPLYLDFWPIVKDLWIKVIKIKPILVLISDKDKITDYGDYTIHEIKAVPNINTGLQSQIARMYVTKFYPDNVCITSDIDMFPLSHHYFNNMATSFSDDDLLILSSDAYKTQRYPICYNAAKGKTFNEILGLDITFYEYVNKLSNYNWGWDTDELYFGLKVNEFNDKTRIKKIPRGWVNGIANNRIDRVVWGYDKSLLKNDGYIDCHSLRPYQQYKPIIDELINNRIC